MTFKVIRSQGQGQKMTSAPIGTNFKNVAYYRVLYVSSHYEGPKCNTNATSNKKAVRLQRLPRDARERTIRQYTHGLLLKVHSYHLVPIAGLYGPK